MKWIATALPLILVLAFGLHLRAGEEEGEAATRLARRLAAYDRHGGGNTIPIEQEILDRKGAGDVDGLLPFVNHDRFGETVAWAACMAADAKSAETVVGALMEWSDEKKAAIAPYVARMPGEAGATFLTSIGVDATTPAPLMRRIRAANLLRGDPRTTKNLQADLASKYPGAVQEALLTLGDTQAARFLDEVVPLVEDERVLPEPVLSSFQVEKREELSPGRVRVTRTSPRLDTVGALALEVANRLVLPTTPDYIAWWYEWEKGPRFGFGAEGRARLERWFKAASRGAGEPGVPLSEAVDAAFAWLRSQREERPPGGVGVESWKRDGSRWTLRLVVGEETVAVRVDDDRTVTAAPE